ncbi:MAG: hypothetical protein H7287_12470 [Thermoleophilia bacterium]|nr:hypothetical protein [Thermoleophilia bacterium]
MVQLASGVRFQRLSVNGAHVTDLQLQQAMLGVAQLPLADQRLMASTGVVIQLLPMVTLNGTAQLGATNISENLMGRAVPTSMYVTVGSSAQIPRLGVDAIGETVQHEVGHVISVVTTGDQSEAAAIRYAAEH